MRVIMSPDARLGTATSAHGSSGILFFRRYHHDPTNPPRNPPYATSPPRRSANTSMGDSNSLRFVSTYRMRDPAIAATAVIT
jgi:hypothetical protein